MELPTADNPVRLVCGDALTFLRTLPDRSVDAVVTDPPYSERTHEGQFATTNGHQGIGYDGSKRQPLGYEAWTVESVKKFVPELARVCGGWIVLMTDHVLAPAIHEELTSLGRYVFAPLPYYAPGSRCRLSGDGPSSWTIWIIVSRTSRQARWGTLPGGYVAGEGWREREHMGGKPTRLMQAVVRDYSRRGDVVLDPFMGSGTTGVACVASGRRFVGVEIDPCHFATAQKRINAALGVGGLFPAKPAAADLFTTETT